MAIKIYTDMVGLVMSEVTSVDNELRFKSVDGRAFMFAHEQDCCEHVYIEDIIGDLSDLVGAPIVEAELVSSEHSEDNALDESVTWSFYRYSTVKGTVTVRWCGTSNGYYSESVSFSELMGLE